MAITKLDTQYLKIFIQENYTQYLTIERQKEFLFKLELEDLLSFCQLVSNIFNFNTITKIIIGNEIISTTSFLTDIITHYPNEFKEKYNIMIYRDRNNKIHEYIKIA